MKKMLILLLVLGFASAASAYPEADFEDLTVGALAGQAGGSGWSAGYDSVGVVDVAQETGNQFLRYAGTGSTEQAHRDITGFTSDAYTLTYRQRWSAPVANWGNGTSEIQIGNAGRSLDPIHIKYEGGTNGQAFKVGNEVLINLTTLHNENTAGTWGGGAEADYWKDPLDTWVNVMYAVDADAADKANAIAVYWEKNDGSMGLLGLGTIQLGDETTVMADLKTAFKAGLDNTIDIDDLTIVDGLVPEPATIMMLGLGGLALIRKRR